MSIFKRPLLALGVTGFCALVAAALLPFFVTVSVCMLCAVCGLGGLFLRNTRKIAVCSLAAAVALSGFLVVETVQSRPLAEFDGKTVAVVGTATETGSVSHNVVSVTVKVTGGDLPAGTKVYLHAPFADLPPVYGDEIRTTATLSRADIADRLVLFDPAKANRTFLSGWTEKSTAFRVLRRDSRSFGKSLSLAKSAVSEALLSGMTQDVRPLLRAMCLGDKGDLSDDVIADFRRAGVSHLLVVSGLHTSIVAMGLYGLLRKLRVTRKTASAAALVLLWAFALLVGFHPSVVRACVLNTFVLSGNLFRRRADGLNSLGGGLLLLWLCNPYCVCDVGLWLSFGATYGLLRWLPPMTRACNDFFKKHNTGKAERSLRFVFESLCVTLAATLPILPICAVVFEEVSLVAPLSNLLCVFAATLLLWCAAGALLLSAVHLGFLAGGLRLVATAFSRYLLWATSLCGGFAGATVSTDEPYRKGWVVVTLLAVVFLWKCRGKKPALVGLSVMCAGLVALCVGDTLLSKGKLDVSLTRAYGDNAVVLEKDGEICLLVDGGNGWTAAKSALDRENVARVECVAVLDPARKITRKWREFSDRVEVEQYVLFGDNKTAVATFKGDGNTVVTENEYSLFDGAVAVKLDGERVTVTTAAGETNTIDLTDTKDVSFRLH